MDITYLFEVVNKSIQWNKIIKLKRNFSQFLNKIGKKKSRKKKEKNNSQGKYKKELCNLNIMFVNKIW